MPRWWNLQFTRPKHFPDKEFRTNEKESADDSGHSSLTSADKYVSHATKSQSRKAESPRKHVRRGQTEQLSEQNKHTSLVDTVHGEQNKELTGQKVQEGLNVRGTQLNGWFRLSGGDTNRIRLPVAMKQGRFYLEKEFNAVLSPLKNKPMTKIQHPRWFLLL